MFKGELRSEACVMLKASHGWSWECLWCLNPEFALR